MTAKEIIESMTKEDALNLWMETVKNWNDCEGGNGRENLTKERLEGNRNKFKINYNIMNPNIIEIERKGR